MNIQETWQKELLHIGDYVLHTSQLVIAIALIFLTFIGMSLVRKGLGRMSNRVSEHTSAQLYIVGRILHYVILVSGILLALSILGISFSKLALVISALSIGIGLGLQSVVHNFISGLILLLEKSLKVGDFIELDSGVTGEVIDISMRATLLRTNDNIDILIPNSVLTSGNVVNWTLSDNIRRFRIPFGVAYGSDKEQVKQAALDAAASIPYTLNKPSYEPSVWMTGFGDSSLNFELGVWVASKQVKRPSALQSDYLWALDDQLRKYQVEIPFPQRDLHLRSGFLPTDG